MKHWFHILYYYKRHIQIGRAFLGSFDLKDLKRNMVLVQCDLSSLALSLFYSGEEETLEKRNFNYRKYFSAFWNFSLYVCISLRHPRLLPHTTLKALSRPLFLKTYALKSVKFHQRFFSFRNKCTM